MLLWLAIELATCALTRRVPPRAMTPETVAIAAFLGLYGIGMLVWAPEYLGLVRLLAGPYTRFIYDPFLASAADGPRGRFSPCSPCSRFSRCARVARHPGLLDVFALGRPLVSLLAGAAQQKELRYHFYPSFALAIRAARHGGA